MRTATILFGVLLAGAATAPASVAQAPPALAYTQPLTPPAVRAVQDRLRQAGNYNGRVDGIWGADSQAALERFQQTHALQVTGQLNQVTATALGIAPPELLATGAAVAPSGGGTVAASTAPGALSPDAIRAVQNRLRQLNFYSGNVDGILGADTQAAIERFQQGRGLQATGQLNPGTVAALGLNPNDLASQAPR